MKTLTYALLLFYSALACAGERASSSDKILIYNVIGAETLPVLQARAKEPVMATAGEEMNVGDEIRTPTKVVALLRDWNNSEYTLAPNSRLKIAAHKPNNGAWTFQLLTGAIHCKVETNPVKSMIRFKVQTATGVAGVRGTEFLVSFNESQVMRVDTHKGDVLLGRSPMFEPGSFVEVTENMFAEIGPDQRKPIEAPKTDAKAFEESLKSNQIPDGSDTTVKIKKYHSIQDCVNLGKGWHAVPGEGAMGNCY